MRCFAAGPMPGSSSVRHKASWPCAAHWPLIPGCRCWWCTGCMTSSRPYFASKLIFDQMPPAVSRIARSSWPLPGGHMFYTRGRLPAAIAAGRCGVWWRVRSASRKRHAWSGRYPTVRGRLRSGRRQRLTPISVSMRSSICCQHGPRAPGLHRLQKPVPRRACCEPGVRRTRRRGGAGGNKPKADRKAAGGHDGLLFRWTTNAPDATHHGNELL